MRLYEVNILKTEAQKPAFRSTVLANPIQKQAWDIFWLQTNRGLYESLVKTRADIWIRFEEDQALSFPSSLIHSPFHYFIPFLLPISLPFHLSFPSPPFSPPSSFLVLSIPPFTTNPFHPQLALPLLISLTYSLVRCYVYGLLHFTSPLYTLPFPGLRLPQSWTDMGPFCWIQSNPTHKLTDPIQSNPIHHTPQRRKHCYLQHFSLFWNEASVQSLMWITTSMQL